MSDYRKREIGRVLNAPAPFYRLQVSADGLDITSKHLNITEDELVAIRDLLACQHEGEWYTVGTFSGGVESFCKDCDALVAHRGTR